ncbi:FAD-dependent thymidylate synthase [Effusibacillus lacus]|uniref:Thymidylate synthase n=1 Tax=Effusibacillus lacus TaxID=1348429 RepID=A0A292YQ56_9BACL|nr:FAD-dependent thymidylate synthase [Effusibacillus lacus]TCS70639.1 thymidylate synthase Thy1 [Effusibacillus lacus]GAX90635.1 hypothetical protein [Effusibacillus lacus]
MENRIKPRVKILRYSDPDRLSLAKNAAIFLGKMDEENTKRPLNMLKMGHTSVFRGEHVKFEFWTTKVVYDHLVTYTTAQMRACGGLRANEAHHFIPPVDAPELYEIGQKHLETYKMLVHGIDPETNDPTERMRLQTARSVAPISVELHYILQFNFLTLMEAVFPQRIWEPGAQPDTFEVVNMMWEQVREHDSELWDLAKDIYGPEAIAWKKARNRLKKENPELFAEIMEKYGQLKSMWS